MATKGLPHFEAEAKKRQSHGDTAPGKTLVAKLPQAFDDGKSRDKVAAMVGVSPRYVSDAKKIKEASPETFEKLKSGEISMANLPQCDDGKSRDKVAALVGVSPRARRPGYWHFPPDPLPSCCHLAAIRCHL